MTIRSNPGQNQLNVLKKPQIFNFQFTILDAFWDFISTDKTKFPTIVLRKKTVISQAKAHKMDGNFTCKHL